MGTDSHTANRSESMSDELPGMLATAEGVAKQEFPHTMDAQVWAEEFVKTYPMLHLEGVEVADVKGVMFGWFANAIMAGYDTANARLSETRRTNDTARMDWLERQSVEVRTPLVHGSRFDFLSSPTDEDGHEEPGPIRAQIDARIKDETIQPQPASAPCVAAPTGALADIASERRRQVEKEGWTAEHDEQHYHGDLAKAAACYAVPVLAIKWWPWDREWWKPKDQRRNLVRAGALIVAEIERLDRIHERPER